jgi:hypothetical protein
LAGSLPGVHRLRCEAGLSVVLRQQLRLGLSRLRELLGQHLGNALMELLSGAPQQRLIRHVLDE